MAITTSRLMPRTLAARSSSFDLPSGLITDLSKSNSTSAAKVTFSATGFGFGGAGFTSCTGVGAGAGAGAGFGSGAGAGFAASSVAQPAANVTTTSISFLIIVLSRLPEKPVRIKALREGGAHSAIWAIGCPNEKTQDCAIFPRRVAAHRRSRHALRARDLRRTRDETRRRKWARVPGRAVRPRP